MDILDLFKLEGKKALVTGGGSGLGKAMSLALAGAGADVAVCDINPQTTKQVVSEIEELGRTSLAVTVDVTDKDQVVRMVDETVKAFGRLDIAVNNAGMSGGGVPAAETDAEHWNRVMETNLRSVFVCAQAEARVMIKQGKGNIINTASISGFIVHRSQPATAYCTSKGGVVMMTKALASEWVKYNIRVNAVAPGYFKTELTRNLWSDPEKSKEITNCIPMGRIGEAQEMSGAVIFLASEASNYMTGHIIVLDGGYSIW